MAYTLNYSSGTITVNDSTINTTNTSLALPGRNYAGYGSPVDQNLVSLLENFAYYTASPPNAIKGQTWFDTTNVVLKYNIGTPGLPNWVTVAGLGNNVTFGNIISTGNITASSGTITGNVITGTTIVATGNLVTSVETGISATGTNQGTGYQLTKDINVVSASSAGVADGVVLPVTTCGNRITVMNTDATDAVKVYPAGPAQINSLGPSVAYTLAAGGKLDFVSVSASQWYTLNATYS
jgi:hypothetical protein